VDLVDSVSGHQESQEPTCWAIFFSGLAGLEAICLKYRLHGLSFKRTLQLFIPA